MKKEYRFNNEKLHNLWFLLDAEAISKNCNPNAVASVVRDTLDALIEFCVKTNNQVDSLSKATHYCEKSLDYKERKIERKLRQVEAKYRELEQLNHKILKLDNPDAIKNFMDSITVEKFDPESLEEDE